MAKIDENQTLRRLELLSQIKPSSEDVERALQRVRHTLMDKEKKTMSSSVNPKRTVVTSIVPRFAAAAVIILAICLGIQHFVGSDYTSSVIWAEVPENVEKIHTFVYRIKRSGMTGPGKEGFKFISERNQVIYHSFDYGTRTVCYRDGEVSLSMYSLRVPKEFISVFHTMKRYKRQAADWAGLGQSDPRALVKRIISGDYTELGPKTIEGVEAEGIELTGQKISGEKLENAVTRLWVSVETGLPVQIELEGMAYRSEEQVKIIQNEFRWNVELEASVFEPDIPSDYALMEDEGTPITSLKERVDTEEAIPEPDFSELEDLGLLDPEADEAEVTVPLTGRKQIYKAQDEFMSAWPAYEDVREQLNNELQEKVAPDNLSEDELVRLAILLREKFWHAGGCLSRTSYRYGYMARILLELVHAGEPENLAITDALIETIQSVEVLYSYEPNSDKPIGNRKLVKLLSELRAGQFEQIKREVREGRAPGWEDFVRVCELAIVMNRPDNSAAAAREAVEWLIDEADRGGWTAYMQPLNMLQQSINEGKEFGFNIYNARKPGFPEQFRFGRRFISFKGPDPEKRGVYPIHRLKSNPVWHGNH